MSESTNPVFLVDAYATPVLVRIEGRASFANSGGLRDFFAQMLKQGRKSFVVDFLHCASMDSTFLGVLAGAALELRRQTPPGTLTLVRVAERNLELIRNLGLHRLATVDGANSPAGFHGGTSGLDMRARSEIDRARLMLEAHEHLVSTDAANAAKFQDVLAYLRRRLETR